MHPFANPQHFPFPGIQNLLQDFHSFRVQDSNLSLLEGEQFSHSFKNVNVFEVTSPKGVNEEEDYQKKTSTLPSYDGGKLPLLGSYFSCVNRNSPFGASGIFNNFLPEIQPLYGSRGSPFPVRQSVK